MTGVLLIGVDPGGRETGIVTVHHEQPIAHNVLVRQGDDDMPGPGYIADVLVEIAAQITAGRHATGATEILVAVEGVTAPNPHQRRRDGNSLTNPTGIIGTAIVLGAVIARFGTDVIVIRPQGNGTTRAIHLYPPTLRPATGQGRGHDRLRHARSAFDVALAARFHAHRRTAGARP